MAAEPSTREFFENDSEESMSVWFTQIIVAIVVSLLIVVIGLLTIKWLDTKRAKKPKDKK